MKLTAKLIVILGTFFMLSCMDMYNEVAEELGTEYNYFLAAANNDGTYIYSLNDSGEVMGEAGKTTAIANYGGSGNINLAVHHTGNFLYIPVDNSNSIAVKKINNDGTLTDIETEPVSATPASIIIHPNGKHLYCAGYVYDTDTSSYTSFHLWMFQVNNDGSLTPMDTSVINLSNKVSGMAIDPSGIHLYINTGSLYVYTIKPDGSLNSSPDAYTPDTGISLQNIYIDSNNHVYVLGKKSSPSAYYIYLLDTVRSPYLLQQLDVSEFSPKNIEGNPSGNVLYCTYYGFLPVMINHDGTLTQLTSVTTPSGIEDMVVHPNGKYIYVATGSSTKNSSYRINTDGTIDIASGKIIAGTYSPRYGLALIRKKK